MKLRALLLFGLLPGCFLLEDEAASEQPDCRCPPGACGPVALGDACGIVTCSCESGTVCDLPAGVCGPPCELPTCEPGRWGDLTNDCGPKKCSCGLRERLDPPPAAGELGICSPCSCSGGLVCTDEGRCVSPRSGAWSFPALVGGHPDPETSLDELPYEWASGFGWSHEADGDWLWFVTNRWSVGTREGRLARVRLVEPDLIDPDSLEDVGVTPADVGWSYELSITQDGSELFIGLAAPGPAGWGDVSLHQFVRGPEGFVEVGVVEAVPSLNGWTPRPALLNDRRTLVATASDKRPVVYRRATDQPGDASFVRIGVLDLGPEFPNTETVLGAVAAIPAGGPLGVVAAKVEYRETGVTPVDWRVVAIDPSSTGDMTATASPFAAVIAEEPLLGARSENIGGALSADECWFYQYRHGYFFVSHAELCP